LFGVFLVERKEVMDTKDFAIQLKSLDESGTFEGRLSVYGNVDETGDVVERGAFTKTLREGGGLVPLLWQHDSRQPIGSLELRDSPTALLAKGTLVMEIPVARQAYELLKRGILRGLSIGYVSIREMMDQGGQIRRLKELRLYEGSLVTFPANTAALVTGVKHVQEPAVSAADVETMEAFRNAARDLKEFHRRMIDGD
jgi:uncharacterized protein